MRNIAEQVGQEWDKKFSVGLYDCKGLKYTQVKLYDIQLVP